MFHKVKVEYEQNRLRINKNKYIINVSLQSLFVVERHDFFMEHS